MRLVKTYLTFLFLLLLACNSKKNEQYIVYIRQFNESIQILNYDNSFIYSKFNQANFENPAKNRDWLVYVNKVKKQRIRLTNFIDSKLNEMDSLSFNAIIQYSNLEQNRLAKRVSINKADITIIGNEMTKYKDSMQSFVFNQEKYELLINSLNSALNIDSLDLIRLFSGKSVSLAEALACLMKLKSEIVFAENNFINYAYSQIDVSSFKFSKIEAFVVPNSQILPVGYPYLAEIYLTSIDTTVSYGFVIDGQKFETKSGVGKYQFQVNNKPAVYSKNGSFFYIRSLDGEIQNYPFKIEYEVLEKK